MLKIARNFMILLFVLVILPYSALADLTIAFVDVGQGDAALVQADGMNMLIDAGPNSSADALLSSLAASGISKVDILVGTHPHEDHIGGMDEVLAKYSVGAIWMPKVAAETQTFENLLLEIKAKGLKITEPEPRSVYKLGGAEITVLAPFAKSYDELNDYSIILLITYGSTSFLFTGDAEKPVEEELLNRGDNIDVDVLKVGHHGSTSSTSQAFLDAVSPLWAVISCGQDNTYGHPHAETLAKFHAAGVTVLRTDINGTITFTSDGKSISLKEAMGRTNTDEEAAAAIATTPTPRPDSDGDSHKYIGNKNSKVFHLPSCNTLPAAKNQVYFSSRDDAIAKGYRPCKNCNP